MKTQYKFIHFVKIKDKPKTSVWSCRTNSDDFELGIIEWYPAWRQYCFYTMGIDAVFNVSCFEDIKHFIGQLVKTMRAL